MGWNNHIMTAPIGMGDISSAVGVGSLDLGTLIRDGSINKWAKYKPQKVAGAPVGLLTDSQRKFGPNDGSRYGLSVNITGDGGLASLHNSSFEYVGRPGGGITSEPYRMTDFLQSFSASAPGYSDQALPNPGFAINAASLTNPVAYVDIKRSVDFMGGYNIGNAVGVDIAEMVFGVSETLDLTHVYPAILCGSYFTLLCDGVNGDVNNPVYSPLKVNDNNYPGVWYADFTKPVHGTSTKPFGAGQTLTCSIIALQLGSNTFDQTTLNALKSSWLLDDGSQLWLSHPASPIPISNTTNACGISLRTANAQDAGMIVAPNGVAWSPISGYPKTGIQARYSIANAEASSAYSTSARVGSGPEVTKSISITAGQTSGVQAFTATELGVVFSQGDTYSITISIFKSGSLHRTQTYQIAC